MAVLIPQVVTEDRASGAQVIDGSLKFDLNEATHLLKTFSTVGNSSRFTWSYWIKRTKFGHGGDQRVFSSSAGNGNPGFVNWFTSNDVLEARHYNGSSWDVVFQTTNKFRDTGWYHIVCTVDVTESAATDRVKIYVNGTRETLFNNTTYSPARYASLVFNGSNVSAVGSGTANGNQPLDAHLSNYYAIDGQALGPESFGYTDPLTNTWRPKKYNKSSPNNGTTWSSSGSSSASLQNGNWGQVFDGTLYMYGGSGASNGPALDNGSITFAPSGLSGRVITAGVRGGSNKTYTVNGQAMTFGSSNAEIATIDLGSTQTIASVVGTSTASGTWAQFYWIAVDGVLLIDGLNDPKGFGKNGFYFPFDGNTPIGKDQSGRGNDFKSVNFGGSTDITKATGARPILNTGSGGNVARPGVFGSEVSAFYETTSASNSGGQYYFSHDSSAKPTFSFVRGATYTFDYSASSSHPLRFATAADAAGSTEYTDGTSISGNVIKFTVPHNAPDTLYYYCNVHNGMGNSITVTTDETKADPYAWKCILAMPMISEHDVSGNMNCTTTNDTITNNSVAFNDDQSIFYNRSADPDGSQYFSGVDLSSWNIEQPWTIEFWWYRTGANTNNHGHFVGGTIGGTNQYGPTYRDNDNDWQFNYKGQNVHITPSPALQTNKWEHHAFTSDGNNITYFRDGVFQTTASASGMTGSWGSSNEIFRGAAGWNSQYVVGHVCDMRVYTVEKYTTAGFIPASTNPDILPDSPSGVATKSKLKKITDGAVAFDGTGDALVVSDHADLRFGTGAFTIECFVYFNSFDDNYPSIISKYTGGTASWIMRVRNTGAAVYYSAVGGGSNEQSSTKPIKLKKWHHIAMVREGTGSNQAKMYVDGTLVVTATDATDYTDTQEVTIGAQNASDSNVLNGYMSNVRIIKGTALYTSDFIPPTRKLTNVTNTKLLCCQSTTSATAAAVAPNLDTYTVRDNNGGTYWSGATLSNGSNLAGLFDASLSTNAQQSTNGTAASVTNFGPVNVSNTVSFYSPDGDARYTLNGGSEVSVSGTGWHDISFSGTLTSFTFQAPGNARIFIFGMKIDGTQLVDIITRKGDASVTNFNPFNTDINTVRGQESGYATFNPLVIINGGSSVFSDGNLSLRGGGTNGATASTINPTSGKHYLELDIDYVSGQTQGNMGLGIVNEYRYDVGNPSGNSYPSTFCGFFTRTEINSVVNGSETGAQTTEPTVSYTLGLAVDYDAKTMSLYLNGVAGNTVSFSSVTNPLLYFNWGNTNNTMVVNFGQKPFKFPPPDGFQPLTSSTARPDTVITHPEKFVNATIYDGNNSTSRSISTGHKPDLIWCKSRNYAYSNSIYDSVRGPLNRIKSNSTDQQANDSSSIISFDADGYTTGNSTSTNTSSNSSKYVAFTWKAGGKDGTNAFNIDDVGYANASDVNMNVGALNSSAYDQSQTWSSSLTSTQNFNLATTRAFDGNLSNLAATANATNANILFTKSFTNVTKLRVYMDHATSYRVRINGGTWHTDSSLGASSNASWRDLTSIIPANGTVNTIESDTGGLNNGVNWSAVEVNGRLLVDNGVSVTNVPSIAPTGCSVGTKQGFSIIQYTGVDNGTARTVPHGLSQKPDFMIVKGISDNSRSWIIYHSALGATKYFQFDNTSAGTNAGPWNNTEPTSKFFTLGTSYNNVNVSGGKSYIAYLWHDVPGLQKFGSYKCNGDGSGGGDEDGPFVELGFKPALILFRGNYASDWTWIDNARCATNYNDVALRANYHYGEIGNARGGVGSSSQPENYAVDFLSNGFKIRASGGSLNSGTNIVTYAAWAEAPAFNLYGAQSNAR